MTFLPRNRLIEQSKAKETVMKKDVAFAIALIVAGGFGLVSPPTFSAGAEPATAKPAHVVRNEPRVKSSLPVNASAVRVIKCSRDARAAQSKANLLHKVSVALSDLDSVISLQSM
jgi:hypothetical protein